MLMGLALFFCLPAAIAQDIKLAWNANPESDIAGYLIEYGTQSGNLTKSIDVGLKTTATLSGLPLDVVHYATVLAYNSQGLFSNPSAEISFTPKLKPPLLVKNENGLSQPITGNLMDFGLVRVGALGDTQSFTITNTGTTTLNGLRFEIDSAFPANFTASGIPVIPVLPRNGDFEQNLEHWIATGNVKSSVLSSASSGTRVARLGGNDLANTGDLKQSFATIPGKTYQLTMAVAVEATNTKFQTLRTTVVGSKTLLNDDFTLNRPVKDVVTWTTRTLSFTADSTSTTIVFANTALETLRVDLLLDKVRIIDPTQTTNSAPQIPTSLAPGMSITFGLQYRPTSGGNNQALLKLVADQVSPILYETELKGAASIPLGLWLAQNGIQDGAGGNKDKDTLNNLQEYAFGTDPGKNQQGAVSAENGKMVVRGTPAARVMTPAQGGFQGLFARRKDHASMNLRYTPQFSADLVKWVNASASPEKIGDDGEMELVSITAPTAINGKPARFFRVGLLESAPPTLAEWLASSEAEDGSDGNPDGDTLNNLQEFAFGTNPRMGQGSSVSVIDGLIASRGSPSVRMVQASSPQFHGMFGRRKAAAGIVYRPQFSADLIKWVDATAAPVKLADDGEMEVVSVAAPATINGKPARFFRVGTLE